MGCSPVLCGLCVLYYCNLCKHCVPQLHLKGCSPVLCGLYTAKVITALWTLCTTSAAPERLLERGGAVPCDLVLYRFGVLTERFWEGRVLTVVACELCTSAAPERAVLQFSVYSVYSILQRLSQHCVPQLHLKGLFSSSLCTLCTLYCKGYHSTVYLRSSAAPQRLFSSSPMVASSVALFLSQAPSVSTLRSQNPPVMSTSQVVPLTARPHVSEFLPHS